MSSIPLNQTLDTVIIDKTFNTKSSLSTGCNTGHRLGAELVLLFARQVLTKEK